ncbi:MAG: pirin family protein [Candidatus Eremiobacteraeota bacterium]|nr:pirin family protein [Candidatus Eremiobacteraeota bacterium]
MNTLSTTPAFSVQRSSDRATFDHGWLKTFHSFSFAQYHDPRNVNWGALRVFNDDYIGAGEGFPTHPHRDMEIVTYVLDGELAHEDSMGNEGVVGPGGVQFMSAGTGVRHSEFNNRADKLLHLVQMWILPGKLGQPPAYGQMEFTIDERRNRWLDIVSGRHDVSAPIRITQDATFSVARIEDMELVREFSPKRFGFIFVADGTLEVNGETLHKGDAVRSFDVSRISAKGHGELTVWDLPAIS